MRRDDVTVQIMLGGLSTRMGRDKALVTLGGQTLLDRALARWQGYGAGVQLSVGAAERRALAPRGIPAVADVYPERGPLGGLHAGLKVCPTELLLLVAVDCPFLAHEQADGLLAAIGTADACVYTLDGHLQPLFGLYRRKSCATPTETLILHGDKDKLVPCSISEDFYRRIVEAGLEDRAELVILKNAGHGTREFFQPETKQRILAFFDRYLKGENNHG